MVVFGEIVSYGFFFESRCIGCGIFWRKDDSCVLYVIGWLMIRDSWLNGWVKVDWEFLERLK